ncbi:MAG: hypothetical protein P8O04_05190 [Flavobacteriaceae bacterium]|nr:hypothetical protein [Flavobacteriales bacterium]MDG1271835.1 hypothetical protein [Flavobacteriaceae bacterium]
MSNKETAMGFVAALLGTASCTLLFTAMVAKGDAIDSLIFLYQQNKLGALISLGALVNLVLFFVAIRRNKNAFATGVLICSILLVVLIAILKINS